jgi:hypothetical protein
MERMLSGIPTGSARTGGYCQARARLPLEMVRTLTRQVATLVSGKTPAKWLWKGLHVKLVDGTGILMADSDANQAGYPGHIPQGIARGVPLARVGAVLSLSNGVALDMAMGPFAGKGTGEMGLFRSLREGFVKGDLMLADSYFCTYWLIADMQRRGVEVLFEQQGARITDFRRGQRLGARDHLVRWKRPQWRSDLMSREEYEAYPREITVREVKVDQKILVTTLVNPKSARKAELGELFWSRWNVELDLRNLKTTMGMEKLSCKSPQMCEKEMWVYLLAYNLIRLLMAQAAAHANALPRHISFKHTLQIWIAFNQRQFLGRCEENFTVLFALIAQIRVGQRPGRVEPRALRYRAKAYPHLDRSRARERREIKQFGHVKSLKLKSLRPN